MKQYTWFMLLLIAIGYFPVTTTTAQDRVVDPASKKENLSRSEIDTAAIKKMIASYAEAFNSRNAKSLAQHWSPEGVYTSRMSGDEIVGRTALEKEFKALFAEVKDAKLELSTNSIDFVSPNVAIEQGKATVSRPKHSPQKTEYSAVFVKRDGQWLIDRVSEEDEPYQSPSHYEKLKDLEWMIGKWVDQVGEGSTITTECKWTRNQNFITRSFTASVEDRIGITGIQFVGWDPARKQIRSWVFDSDGGFSEGTWERKGKRWVVKTTATLANGSQASATSVFRLLDENSFGWQKINRVVDGEILPNIDEVIIVRDGEQ